MRPAPQRQPRRAPTSSSRACSTRRANWSGGASPSRSTWRSGGAPRASPRCIRSRSAARRHVPLRHEAAGRHGDVGQVGVSRDRCAGAAGVHQFVLGRERRPDAASDGADLAARDADCPHLRGAAGRQDQAHHPLVAATTRPRKSRQTFDAGHDSMRQGWTGSLDQLEAHLANAR